jgi:flagellar biosynthesis protein FlhB
VADGNRTENATPRRLFKARQEGDVPRSRELSAALVLMTVVLYLWWGPQNWKAGWHMLFVRLLETGTRGDLTARAPILNWVTWQVCAWAGPPLALTWMVAVAGSFGLGGFVISPARLTPKPERLNPVTNLGKLFSFGAIQGLLKSLIPMSFVLYFSASLLFREWTHVLQMSRMGINSSLAFMLTLVFEIAWKAALVFSLWAGFDALLSYFNYGQQHRMTQQEVREDAKETEGHPAIKGRIRRLQRDMRRRRMMRDVTRATVVITNPTEYAVALEYKPETMAAPVVVAKGRNLLAQQIKREARWLGIPLVENVPLAQALYRAAEVGQSIPAKLYAAVAEILAFIYRSQGLMNQASTQRKNRP